MKILGTPFSIENSTIIKSLKQEFLNNTKAYTFDNIFIDDDGGLYYYVEEFHGRTNTKKFITKDEKYIELFKAIKTLDKHIY